MSLAQLTNANYSANKPPRFPWKWIAIAGVVILGLIWMVDTVQALGGEDVMKGLFGIATFAFIYQLSSK